MSVLNYLKLPEPQYIPKYTPVDGSMEMGLSSEIKKQYDVASAQYAGLSGLYAEAAAGANETQQKYIDETITSLESDISSQIEAGDFRMISNKLPSIAKKFSSAVKPIITDIQKRQQYMEEIQKNTHIPDEVKNALVSGIKNNKDLIFNSYQTLPSEWYTLDDMIDISKNIPSEKMEEFGIDGSKTKITDLSPDVIANRLLPYLEHHGAYIKQNKFYYNNLIGREGTFEHGDATYNLEDPSDRDTLVDVLAKEKLRTDVNAVAGLRGNKSATTTGVSGLSRNTYGVQSPNAPMPTKVMLPKVDDEKQSYSNHKAMLDQYHIDYGNLEKEIKTYQKDSGITWQPDIENGRLWKFVDSSGNEVEDTYLMNLAMQQTALRDRRDRIQSNLGFLNDITLKAFAEQKGLDESKLELRTVDGKEQVYYNGRVYQLSGELFQDSSLGFGVRLEGNPDNDFTRLRNKKLRELEESRGYREITGLTFRTDTEGKKANPNHEHAVDELSLYNPSGFSYTDVTTGETFIIGDDVEEGYTLTPNAYVLDDGNGRAGAQVTFNGKVNSELVTKTLFVQGTFVDSFVQGEIARSGGQVLLNSTRLLNEYINTEITYDPNKPVTLELDQVTSLGMSRIDDEKGNAHRVLDEITISKKDGYYFAKGKFTDGSVRNLGNAADVQSLYTTMGQSIVRQGRIMLNNSTKSGSLPIDNIQYRTEIDSLKSAEGFERNGNYAYLVKDNDGNIMGQSGVTIGNGVDLGQQSHERLKNWLRPELYNKVKDYIGLKKSDAEAKLNEQPLNLTRAEAEEISGIVIDKYLTDLKRTVRNFDSLQVPARTALLHAFYHKGVNSSFFQELKKHITTGDYRSAIALLKSDKTYSNRYTALANELQRVAIT